MRTALERTDKAMTKAQPGVDKNLQNTVNEIEQPDLNAHENQQLNQEHMDQRKLDQQHFSKKAYENENQE